ILFAHVAATIGIFAALTIEWVGLKHLSQATSYEQAREWARLWRFLAPLGVPSVVVVLVSGIYMAARLGAWSFAWTKVAVPTLVIVAIAATVFGPPQARLMSAIATNAGRLPPLLLRDLKQPLFLASLRLRAALLVGLVFEMTARPDPGGAVVMVGFVLAGVVWAIAAGRGMPSAAVSRGLAWGGGRRGGRPRSDGHTRPRVRRPP